MYMINSNYPDLAANGKRTFAGAVRKLFRIQDAEGNQIGIWRDDWSESTAEEYLRDYDQRLIPNLPLTKPIEALDKNDYEDALQKLDGKRKNEHKTGYDEASMDTFRRLLLRAHLVAFKQGYTDNDLWGTSLQVDQSRRDAAKLYRIKKSFTAQEELAVADVLRGNVTEMSGERMCLLLMLFCGMRNNEAAALQFGDLHFLRDYPEDAVLYIKASTVGSSNQRKAGGKTRNANRMLPIPKVVCDCILERKQGIADKIRNGTWRLPEDTALDDLPIGCRGDKYDVHCSSPDLTKAGKALFREAGILAERIAEIDCYLQLDQRPDNDLEEKEPTTYLLRRNAGTHFKSLGLRQAEIQYVMGHDIDDPAEPRNSFANDEKLHAIKQKLELHPLCFVWDRAQWERARAQSSQSAHCSGRGSVSLTFQTTEPRTVIKVEVTAEDGTKLQPTVSVLTSESVYTGPIIEQEKTITAYHNAERRRKNGKNSANQ